MIIDSMYGDRNSRKKNVIISLSNQYIMGHAALKINLLKSTLKRGFVRKFCFSQSAVAI